MNNGLPVTASKASMVTESQEVCHQGLASVDYRRLLFYVLLNSVVITSFFIFPGLILFVFIGLIFWSLLGAKQSIQALSLAVVIRYLNPAAFDLPMEIGPLSWFLLIAAAVRNAPFTPSESLSKVLPLLTFSVAIALISLAASSHVTISLMKLMAFTIGSVTVLSSFDRLVPEQVAVVREWLFSLMAVIVILSMITLLRPSVAYFLNGSGFQGILNHPQTFGALIAPFAAWLLAGVFFRSQRLFSMSLLSSFILISIIIATEARTALAAVVLSMVATFIMFLVRNKKYQVWGSIAKSIVNLLLLLIILVTFVATYKPARDIASSYVFKRSSETVEEALSSRSRGVVSQWENFLQKPILGNGFGIYPGSLSSKEVRTFMGIPVSAPVEKGFLPTAILEEIGMLGTVLFLIFIAFLTNAVVEGSDIRWAGMYFGCLFVNVGEAVFFSVGGIGLLYWLLIGLSASAYKLDGDYAGGDY